MFWPQGGSRENPFLGRSSSGWFRPQAFLAQEAPPFEDPLAPT